MNSQLARNKNTLCPMKKPAGCGISLSLQDELVATIHGAFEVAVDIAVLEVTKLVSQAMGDLRDQMKGTQRENESLKQRLQRAEDKLDSVRSAMGESQNCSLKPQVTATIRTDEATQASSLCVATTSYPSTDHTELVQNVTLSPETDKGNRCVGKKCDNGRVLNDFSDPVSKQPYCDHQPTTESNEGAAGLCIPKAESPEQPCQDTVAPHNNSSPLHGGVEMCASEPIKIKLEDLGPDCCFESMSAGGDSLFLVQSKIMEQWKPELVDVHNQDPHALLPDASLAADMTDGPPYSNDRPSLSSGFCNPFPSGEPGPAPVPQQQLPGASSRSSHSPDQPSGVPNTCKVCGQSFQLPSLLRRHHSQCQQRLRQGWRPTGAGAGVGERARFPLYAPGCSPFRCTECDRDFNRLENLKTHLRIHTGERPYVCSVCSKRFRHSGALTRHFRIHTGEKPYVCGQCGKTFRNCGGLKFHQRSHSRQ